LHFFRFFQPTSSHYGYNFHHSTEASETTCTNDLSILLLGKPWLGTKHTCPECDACVGIHFHGNYTGMATHPKQDLASIPREFGKRKVTLKAF